MKPLTVSSVLPQVDSRLSQGYLLATQRTRHENRDDRRCSCGTHYPSNASKLVNVFLVFGILPLGRE